MSAPPEDIRDDLHAIGEIIARIDAQRMGAVSREMAAAHYLAMRSHAGALLALARMQHAALLALQNGFGGCWCEPFDGDHSPACEMATESVAAATEAGV